MAKLEGLPVKLKGNGDPDVFFDDFIDLVTSADGIEDLFVKIQDIDGVFEAGTAIATLTGNLLPDFGSTPFQGEDEVCITQ